MFLVLMDVTEKHKDMKISKKLQEHGLTVHYLCGNEKGDDTPFHKGILGNKLISLLNMLVQCM